MDRNVIVFGASGKTGSSICKELESKQIPYTVFVRAMSSHKITDGSVQIKHGDVLNNQDVELAFQNEVFTDVIIALGSKELKNATIRSKGTKNIIDAMKKNASKARVHVISALGAGESWKQLKWHGKLISNLLLKSVMADHNKQEELVKKSSYSYHILRPVGLKDKQATGKVHLQNEGFLPGSVIQRADVAIFLVESLLADKTGISAICQNK